MAPDWPQTQGLQDVFAPRSRTRSSWRGQRPNPLPAPPSLASEPSLAPHEIFAFAPYWTLAEQSGFDVGDLSTLSYFGLDVNSNGSIEKSGDGWTGYQSQDLADLIDRAHEAGAVVVLDRRVLRPDDPRRAHLGPGRSLHARHTIGQPHKAKNLDGVNVDFEGAGASDQAGSDSLMARVSSIVRSADDHWQITMDTYASSAGDPDGFYDIQGLASSVDAFFVMAYQMGGPTGSANSSVQRLELLRHRGDEGVHAGRPRSEGHPRPSFLRIQLAHDRPRSIGKRHRPVFAGPGQPDSEQPRVLGPGDGHRLDGVQIRGPLAPDMVRRPPGTRAKGSGRNEFRCPRRRDLDPRDAG